MAGTALPSRGTPVPVRGSAVGFRPDEPDGQPGSIGSMSRSGHERIIDGERWTAERLAFLKGRHDAPCVQVAGMPSTTRSSRLIRVMRSVIGGLVLTLALACGGDRGGTEVDQGAAAATCRRVVLLEHELTLPEPGQPPALHPDRVAESLVSSAQRSGSESMQELSKDVRAIVGTLSYSPEDRAALQEVLTKLTALRQHCEDEGQAPALDAVITVVRSEVAAEPPD
jgi:hypothetical protein